MIVVAPNMTGPSIVSRTECENKNISMRALGMITYFSAFPDGYDVSVEQLMQRFQVDRQTVEDVLAELNKEGLLETP